MNWENFPRLLPAGCQTLAVLPITTQSAARVQNPRRIQLELLGFEANNSRRQQQGTQESETILLTGSTAGPAL